MPQEMVREVHLMLDFLDWRVSTVLCNLTDAVFFYRTADILAANHAHIPNHLFCCSKVPENLKRELEEKKDLHSTQKKKLQRGSQKDFFNRIMQRMQENIATATSAMASGEDLETDLIQNEM
mmetsp:Transcript_5928/g.8716  ORF Transcript_5928/g.8716 Transcript_5928/m.8716 type:complete len:122 (+) Transcript_5928:361-726(+)